MKEIIVAFFTLVVSAQVFAQSDAWVTSDRLDRHTCPDIKCGVVGRLFFREKATIFEQRNGWARITKPYDASCVEGKSEYVDARNASCTPDNGIVGGRFSEWVELKYLSANRPADPAANATGLAAVVGGSDDFRIYERVFVEAASKLIASGKCTENDFREMGGWLKSTSYRNQPIYFTYCGGMRMQNRIYLNASTGETFK